MSSVTSVVRGMNEPLGCQEAAHRSIDGAAGGRSGVGVVARELGYRADRREPAGQRVLGARQDVVDLQRAGVGEDLVGAAAGGRVPVLDGRRGGGIGNERDDKAEI